MFFSLCDFTADFWSGIYGLLVGYMGPVDPVLEWWTGMWDRCFGMRYDIVAHHKLDVGSGVECATPNPLGRRVSHAACRLAW